MTNADEVAGYLKEHPEFFEDYADVLATLQIPHPHGGRAIPIAERQVLTLREKRRVLEGKLRELVQFGEENDSISERLHRFTLDLLAARDLGAVLNAVYAGLRDEFAVLAVAIRIWGSSGETVEFNGASDETRVFAESLSAIYFSGQPMFETGAWFTEGAGHLASLAYIPLHAGSTYGMLVLGSEDAQRFSADKGTLYLTRLGETVSMSIGRYLEL